jgi:hypothetical protein
VTRMNYAAAAARDRVKIHGSDPVWTGFSTPSSSSAQPRSADRAPATKAGPKRATRSTTAKKATVSTKSSAGKKTVPPKRAAPAQRGVARASGVLQRGAPSRPVATGHPGRTSKRVNGKINTEYQLLGVQLRDGHMKAARNTLKRLTELVANERAATSAPAPSRGAAVTNRNNVGRRA